MHRPPRTIWVAACLVIVWLAQGSTFVALKIAVASLPPFLFSGARFLIVGVTLLTWWVWRSGWQIKLERREALLAAATGAGFFFAGQGAATWASQFLPAGVVAVLNSTMPLWAAMIGWIVFRTRIGILGLLGLLAGFTGVVVLAWPAAGTAVVLKPSLLVTAGAACWAGAAGVVNRSVIGRRPVLITGTQTLVGGVLQMAVAVATGEVGHIKLHAVIGALPAFAFLVVVSSLIGFPVLTWLLSHTRVDIANTAAYVAPAIALALGRLILGEQLTPRTLAGVAEILPGVTLIVLSGRKVARSRGKANRDRGSDERSRSNVNQRRLDSARSSSLRTA